MPIAVHPRVGQLLYCDFSTGFRVPEMVKARRPVIVIAPSMKGRPGLVTVIALSTRKPDPVQPYHLLLPQACLPQIRPFEERESWVKGDMIYAVGFHRLDFVALGKRNPITGKRLYFNRRLDRVNMRKVYRCVLHGINLGELAKYLQP